jgi:hypothetical protein
VDFLKTTRRTKETRNRTRFFKGPAEEERSDGGGRIEATISEKGRGFSDSPPQEERDQGWGGFTLSVLAPFERPRVSNRPGKAIARMPLAD